MKQTLNTSIEKINHLGRKSLEEHLVSEQTLPNSDEKVSKSCLVRGSFLVFTG